MTKALGLGSVGEALGIKTGKNKDQKIRDVYRGGLADSGVAVYEQNEEGHMSHHLTLADGSKYDIGRDGGFRRQSSEGSDYASYEVDPDNQFGKQAVGWVDPLVAAIAGDAKNKEQVVAWFTNAAMSNAESIEDVRQNVLNFYTQFDISPEQITEVLNKQVEDGVLSEEKRDAFLYGVGVLHGGDSDLYATGTVSEGSEASEEAPVDLPAEIPQNEPMIPGGQAPVTKPVVGAPVPTVKSAIPEQGAQVAAQQMAQQLAQQNVQQIMPGNQMWNQNPQNSNTPQRAQTVGQALGWDIGDANVTDRSVAVKETKELLSDLDIQNLR